MSKEKFFFFRKIMKGMFNYNKKYFLELGLGLKLGLG